LTVVRDIHLKANCGCFAFFTRKSKQFSDEHVTSQLSLPSPVDDMKVSAFEPDNSNKRQRRVWIAADIQARSAQAR